ncbi:hypothetical protein MKX47_20190 [Solibacillus sp. FSL R7-0668]|uniref:hypothetical protein n=1 Tax=Solibacillus sp. FSL R7-0668 TaxID=2921688 RepID=UPI0030F5964A
MDSLFKLSYEDQDKTINFLNSKYSDTEILSIIRQLGIDKDTIYTPYLPKKNNCVNLVETILQQDLSSKFLLLLQSEQFYRPSFAREFSHLKFVITEDLVQSKVSKIQNTHKPISSQDLNTWLQSCKKNTVLILGKDSPDECMTHLKNIAKIIEQKGYQTILIKMQPEIDSISNEEKMLAYAAISRFILIEKSEAAGQIDEAKICVFNRLPAIWLQKENCGDTWMQGDYDMDFKFIKTFKYTDITLEQCISTGIDWVENYINDKTSTLNTLYPWRN